MAVFGFWADPQMTTPLVQLTMTVNAQTGGQKDFVLYFGSPDSTVKAVPDPNGSSPTEILVRVVDTVLGNGHDLGTLPEQVRYRLATTQGGLDTAQDNAPLSLGPEVLGGSAVEIWLRLIEPPAPLTGSFTDLVLETSEYLVVNL